MRLKFSRRTKHWRDVSTIPLRSCVLLTLLTFIHFNFYCYFQEYTNCYSAYIPLVFHQQLRTVLSSTIPVKGSAVFTQSTQMAQALLMYIVTKLLLVGGGQSSRREWMALLILIAPGMTTNMASVTWSVNFGSDWTR